MSPRIKGKKNFKGSIALMYQLENEPLRGLRASITTLFIMSHQIRVVPDLCCNMIEKGEKERKAM